MTITLSFGSLAHAKDVDAVAILTSISAVETGGNVSAIGSLGERSEYQFTSHTWKRYSKVPFWKISQSKYHTEVQRVAYAYLEDIKKSIIRRGYEVTPLHVALCWNRGLNADLSRRPDYSERVSNLYVVYCPRPVNFMLKDQLPYRIGGS